jgi:hypothetical protein
VPAIFITKQYYCHSEYAGIYFHICIFIASNYKNVGYYFDSFDKNAALRQMLPNPLNYRMKILTAFIGKDNIGYYCLLLGNNQS